MQMYFIRHAQSENNRLYEEIGSEHGRQSDPPITEKGWQQARVLANFLRESYSAIHTNGNDPHNRSGFRLSHIYCSLMVRSIQTGSVLADTLNLPLVALADLHECGGIFHKDEVSGENIPLPGNDFGFFQKHYPKLTLPEEINRDGWWNRPFEDQENRRKRANRLINRLLSMHIDTQDKIALISHGGFYNHFLGEILGIPHRNPAQENHNPPEVWLSMNNTAITRIDWDKNETKLIYHNRTDFLPTELIT